MYIGHFGVAFASKRVAPRTSLATLFIAAEFIDLLWPVLLTAGLEHVRIAPGITRLTPLDFYDYPLSHSLLAVGIWALLFGAVYYAVRRYARGAIVLAALVMSHWLLDALVHRPDLPLTLHGAGRVGLGLWNHPAAAITLEAAIFAAGALAYLRTTPPLDRIGTYALWPMLSFMAITWVMNFFGPPPPGVGAIKVVALAAWIYVPWSAWADRHRTNKKSCSSRVKLFTSHRAGI